MGVLLGSGVVVTFRTIVPEPPLALVVCTWHTYPVPASRPATIPECDVTLDCVPLSTALNVYLPAVVPQRKIELDAIEVCHVTCTVVADALQLTFEMLIAG
jgi:hypothetical protein